VSIFTAEKSDFPSLQSDQTGSKDRHDSIQKVPWILSPGVFPITKINITLYPLPKYSYRAQIWTVPFLSLLLV